MKKNNIFIQKNREILIYLETVFQISASLGSWLCVGIIIKIPPGFRFIIFTNTSSVISESLIKANFLAIFSKKVEKCEKA